MDLERRDSHDNTITAKVGRSHTNQLKDRYTPSSPTTSGYSESGSEMDNHDSGRVSEMDGSPQITARSRSKPVNEDVLAKFDELEVLLAASKITMTKPKHSRGLSEDYAFPIDSYHHHGNKGVLKYGRMQPPQTAVPHNSSQPENGRVSLDSETLKTLLLSLKDAHNRLHHVERKLDDFKSLFKTLPEENNKSLVILTKAVLELSKNHQVIKKTLDDKSRTDNHRNKVSPGKPRRQPSVTKSKAAMNAIVDNCHVTEADDIRKPPKNFPHHSVSSDVVGNSRSATEDSVISNTFPRRYHGDDSYYQVPRSTRPSLTANVPPTTYEDEKYDNFDSNDRKSTTKEIEFDEVSKSIDVVDSTTPLYAVVKKNRRPNSKVPKSEEAMTPTFEDEDIQTSVSELDDIIRELTTPEPSTPFEVQSRSSTLSRRFPPSSNIDMILVNSSLNKSKNFQSIKKSSDISPAKIHQLSTSESMSSYHSNWHEFEDEICDVSSGRPTPKNKRTESDNSIELSIYSTSSSTSGRRPSGITTFFQKLKSKSKESVDKSRKSTESLSSASGLFRKSQRRNKSADSAENELFPTYENEPSGFYTNMPQERHLTNTYNTLPVRKKPTEMENSSIGEFDNITGDSTSLQLPYTEFDSKSADEVFRDILEDQIKEQADRRRFEQGIVDDRKPDEPPPKPSRFPNRHEPPNGNVQSNYPPTGYTGNRSTPVVPPKTHPKIMTSEELTKHEAMEKLRQKQREEESLQARLDRQKREAEEDAKWLENEELNMFEHLKNPDHHGDSRLGNSSSQQDLHRAGSLGSMEAPPPPSVAPEKPPRKPSKPKEPKEGAESKSKFEMVKPSPTMKLDRTNDQVYKDTMAVVKCVLSMNSITMPAKAEELFNHVKEVGITLKNLCSSLEIELKSLPEAHHREIDMAQKTTNKDLSQVINQLKLVQRFFHTTQVVDYKKCLMAANQVLAMDAKNLLDVVDKARIATMTQRYNEEHGSDSHSTGSHEPEDTYPTH